MINIAVVTSTRAEFGLLMPLIRELRKFEDENTKIELVVTGTHLLEEYGHTIDEIVSLDYRIDSVIYVPVISDTAIDISMSQAEFLIKFTELFIDKKYSAIVILGDRYEMLSIAIAAGNTHTPIFHLCGGDTTEGAIDEWIRHSITKMSYLHFPTNEESLRRIIQMGEDPDRVFNYGSTSIDNILSVELLGKKDALTSIGINDCRYALCTYHPVTMEKGDVNRDITDFLRALEEFPDISFVITKSNADQGGSTINSMLDEASERMNNVYVFSSLGVQKYLSLMKHSEFVLGNSSSGIIEAPALKVPTINIGDRQRGRLQSSSIINCKPDKCSICNAIEIVLERGFKELCQNVISPYGNGNASKMIAGKIIDTVKNMKIELKKKFYYIN